MYKSKMRACLGVLAVVLVLSTVLVSAEESETAIVCQCRCCYLGDCRPLGNASWFVEGCGECTTQLCHDHVRSLSIRKRTARVFETLDSDIPANGRLAEEVDVCEVISVLEAATCPSGGKSCRRSTDLGAECYDRHAPMQMMIVSVFCVVSAAGVLLGLTKNYLPALQRYNYRWFDY